MNSDTDRPPSDRDPRQRRWAEELGGFANDATARLGRFGRRMRITNTAVAGWVSAISWGRLGLIGFVILIAAQIVGDIAGFNRRDVTIDPDDLRKPIDIRILNDGKNVHIEPLVGGKATRSIDVPIPEVPVLPGVPSAPTAPTAPRSPATPSTSARGEASPDADHAIVFEKDGKRVVIDRNGVRVLEGDEARRDATERAKRQADREQAAAAIDASKDVQAAKDEQARRVASVASSASGKEDADPDEAADEQNADRIAAKALASVAGKLSPVDAERMRHAIADDMSLQVKAAVEDAKDEVTSAINDEMRAATRAAPRSLASVSWEFLKFVVVVFFMYLIILKATGNTKRRAAIAVQSAAEVAERESLKRQVSEARMQMMQAQVEPHFLFNTLASIDHLIETDPARASTMQKNLIQYLRAALPQMRENATDLGREADLVRAYLEILKVRMEERLQVSFAIPGGLRSADFPPMMLQSLVENAIKHGLEPKAEGGRLDVDAEIAHGDLRVTVADTGLGFNPDGASTSGTGVGLTNIRERLKLLYGDRASLVIEANVVDGAPLGTRVTICVPYQSKRPA